MAGVWTDHIVQFPLHKDTNNLGNESEPVSLGSLPNHKPSCLPIEEKVWVAMLLQPPILSTRKGGQRKSQHYCGILYMCPLFPVLPTGIAYPYNLEAPIRVSHWIHQ